MNSPEGCGVLPFEVLVSDADHITVRLLASDLQRQEQFAVFGCLANLEQLLNTISNRKPCVLLLGLHTRDSVLETLSLLRQICREFPWLRTIVLSEGIGRDLVLEVFRAGAKGFFDRAVYDPVLLCRCIQCVAAGQIWAKSEELGFVLQAFASTPRIQVTKGVQSLTPRENEVAHLVSDGMSNNEVAQRLGLSIHTVKNYLFSVFDKIGVSNRAELILCLLTSNAPSKNPVTQTNGGRSRQKLSQESRALSVSRGVSLVAKRPS